MMKYKIENREFGNTTWIEILEKNDKKETMTIEIVHCTDPGGKNSLPYMWYKNGFTNKLMQTYLSCHTYVRDSEGGCRGAYNPCVKLSDDEKRNIINFDWLLDDTEENMMKIINECIRIFETAKGKSATEIKIEKIKEYAAERDMEVTYCMPDGWTKRGRLTDPIGAITITNGTYQFKRINGKLCENKDYKKMLLIL